MAVLDKRWHGQNLKMVLHIGNQTYTSYMVDPVTGVPDGSKFIQSIDLSDSDGNTNVNPLGIIASDRISINCFDADYMLSPTNPNGYGRGLTNGQKIELFIYENNAWQPFGVYYTTSFSDVYSDGYHGLTNICAEDQINILGNMEVPVLPVYANISARNLIISMFQALNISNYYIDPELDMSYTWGVLPGTRIRDFLNSVCQRCFARIIMDDAGTIKFIPALTLGTQYNTVTLGVDDIGNLKNINSSNINYNKISVKYYEYGKDALKVLYNATGLSYRTGHQTVSDIEFSDVVVSIENVIITYKSLSTAGVYDAVRNIEYTAYQNGMVLEFDTIMAVSDVEIYIEGYVANNNTLKQSIDIDTGGRVGLQEYTFEPKMQMTDTEALNLCRSIKDYMTLIENKVEIDETALTPLLSIGDRVIIDVDNDVYDGTYMVIELDITFGETYKNSMKLLRLENND